MSDVQFTWNGERAKDWVQKTSWEAVQRMTLYFWNAVQQVLNVSNPRPYTTPSQPGEPPRKRTGFLAAAVGYELDQQAQVGRVGVAKNAIYGLFLELGTKRMRPRHWLLSTLQKVFPQLQRIAESGGQRGVTGS